MGSRTIQINPEALSSIAVELESSKAALTGASFEAPSALGGGRSVEQLSGMERDYIAIRDALVLLIDKTKAFMAQAASDAVAWDQAAADKMTMEK